MMTVRSRLVTDLGVSPESTSRPSRRRRYLLTSAAVVIAVAAASVAVVLIRGTAGTEVRYEVESASGAAFMISWTDADGGLAKAPGSPTETVTTPWSTTVTIANSGQYVSVAADSGKTDDEVTCRIFADGAKKAESTNRAGAICEFTLP